MKEIVLSQGKVALVSDEDYEELSKVKWSATENSAEYKEGRTVEKWYAVRFQRLQDSSKRQTIYMHRLIMNAPKGSIVDHIDGDGLNNVRTNLRVTTHYGNNLHLPKFKKKGHYENGR